MLRRQGILPRRQTSRARCIRRGSASKNANIDDLRTARASAGCHASSSTTSTAAPTARSRCAKTAGLRTRTLSAAQRRREGRRAICTRPSSARRIDLPLLARAGRQQPSLLSARRVRAAAKQAGTAGTGYVLSTLSGCRLEDVKTASRGRLWYQLYLFGGREVAKARSRGRATPVSPRSSSRSTPRSPGCANATCATAEANCVSGEARCRCCRTCCRCSRARAGCSTSCATAG